MTRERENAPWAKCPTSSAVRRTGGEDRVTDAVSFHPESKNAFQGLGNQVQSRGRDFAEKGRKKKSLKRGVVLGLSRTRLAAKRRKKKTFRRGVVQGLPF
ncbi:hypothetical protein R1flu_006538 [Riccia fluitans]|uniref:Uncharacterized protein n=1 Tax=Riccia fluitans TaxID=41844 RepID=A0ABD1YW96_9MARC